ncbi:MAG: acyloxyacyl hydrolase [Acidobacteria bacterium]|nr:acyloxyacyl hydrolase [Acidobacteriota bacterium]
MSQLLRFWAGLTGDVRAVLMIFVIIFFGLLVESLTTQASAAPTKEAGDGAPKEESRLSRGVRRNEFAVWGGMSPHATAVFGGLRPAETKDRQFYILALRYGRLIGSWRHLDLQYVADFFPAAVAADTVVTRAYPPEDSRARGNVYGFGVSPLGVKVMFRPRSRWRPYAGANGGFLRFREPVPLPQSEKFNFTFEIDGGVMFAGKTRYSWFGGVKFHHLSNGGRSPTNRGMNTIQLFFGVSFWR